MSSNDLSTLLNFFSVQESVQYQQFLLPWLIATCIQRDDIATLHQIQQAETGIHLNILLPSGLTSLHVCAINGSIKCADLLLRSAAEIQTTVNEQDQVGFTALYYAVLRQDYAMIDLLIKNGAKLSATLKPSEIGMHLCNSTKNNQVERLKAWHQAGANLDQTDYDGRTPLFMVNR